MSTTLYQLVSYIAVPALVFERCLFGLKQYKILYFKSESPREPWVGILLQLINFFWLFVVIFLLSIASLQIIFEFDYIFSIKRLSN